MLLPLVLLIALAALAFYFMDGMTTREIGVTAARELCRRDGFQFLDDSVVLDATRLVRNDDGRLTLQRTYAFEYSDNGNNRIPGSVTLVGHRITVLHTQVLTLIESDPSSG